VTADSPLAVEVVGLKRSYRLGKGVLRRRSSQIEALRGITFSVDQGELFGLIGPNGAGKTTTIKVLTTLLLPSAGTARVLGFDVARRPRDVRARIGFVFGGDRGLYDRLSALDNLRYFADVYGVDARRQRARIDELLELVGLTGRERERVETYSRGMRQRLHIAGACCTIRRCYSSTSRRSASIRSVLGSSARRLPGCSRRGRRFC
jgi:ABC-2 type transport system ATP-binding protein